MQRGTIIAFRTSDRWTYGQVFYMDSEQLDVKVLGLGDFITLFDWRGSEKTGSLVFIADRQLWEKTLVIKEERKKRPFWPAMVFGYYFRKYRYEKILESKVNPWPPYLYTRAWWQIKKPLTGTVFSDGMFVPHAYQWKTEPFLIDHYNTLKHGYERKGADYGRRGTTTG